MSRHLPPVIALFILAFSASAGPISGQEQGMVRLHGRILDASTGQPIHGASVQASGRIRAHVTDTLGLFVLEVPAAEEFFITVGQLGYRTALVALPATAPGEFTTVLLEANPIELEGLEVLVDRFAQRRRYFQGTIRVLDEAQLLRTPAVSAWDVVRANLPNARPCADNLSVCAMWRGRVAPVSLCLDEQPAWDGVRDLQRYSAADLYMVEVIERGQAVRVYTRYFIEQMLDSGKNLEPLAWGCR